MKHQYMVTTPHDEKDCLTNLDEVNAKGPEFLKKFRFGCQHGDHTGYAFLEGESEADVRGSLPKFEQKNAVIREVDSLNADQIEFFHQRK